MIVVIRRAQLFKQQKNDKREEKTELLGLNACWREKRKRRRRTRDCGLLMLAEAFQKRPVAGGRGRMGISRTSKGYDWRRRSSMTICKSRRVDTVKWAGARPNAELQRLDPWQPKPLGTSKPHHIASRPSTHTTAQSCHANLMNRH